MRELDLNNPNKVVARASAYRHYEDLENKLNDIYSDGYSGPRDETELLINRLKITGTIIANLDSVLS